MNVFDVLLAKKLAGGSSPTPSPIPADCPFTCKPDYFLDNAKEWTIGMTVYQKYNNEYAVGMATRLNASGVWTGPVLFSPVSEDAVKYYVGGDLSGTVGGTVSYNGVVWYYSISYGQSGAAYISGLPASEAMPDYPFSEAALLAFLAEADAANK